MKTKPLPLFPLAFSCEQKTRPGFLPSTSSRLGASSPLTEHLLGAAETAEEAVGEGKQSFSKSDINNTIFWLSCAQRPWGDSQTGRGVSEMMLVQRRNGV